MRLVSNKFTHAARTRESNNTKWFFIDVVMQCDKMLEIKVAQKLPK